jgi:hypothetical protein
MGRFETRWLAAEQNLSALGDLSGRWIDRVHSRRPPRGILLDMDSSVSPTHGEREKSCWNGTPKWASILTSLLMWSPSKSKASLHNQHACDRRGSGKRFPVDPLWSGCDGATSL